MNCMLQDCKRATGISSFPTMIVQSVPKSCTHRLESWQASSEWVFCLPTPGWSSHHQFCVPIPGWNMVITSSVCCMSTHKWNTVIISSMCCVSTHRWSSHHQFHVYTHGFSSHHQFRMLCLHKNGAYSSPVLCLHLDEIESSPVPNHSNDAKVNLNLWGSSSNKTSFSVHGHISSNWDIFYVSTSSFWYCVFAISCLLIFPYVTLGPWKVKCTNCSWHVGRMRAVGVALTTLCCRQL